jgi:hypothetical protein
MFILRIEIPGYPEILYHCKKGLSDATDPQLRLSVDSNHAQTYNSQSSAKSGIGTFKNDIALHHRLYARNRIPTGTPWGCILSCLQSKNPIIINIMPVTFEPAPEEEWQEHTLNWG